MMSKNTCDVKVVLLCKGKGKDPNTFQPQRHETQWFCRRDAIVRCIVSFLFGPNHKRCGSRELIMVFDDDLSRMHLVVSDNFVPSYPVVPNEQKCLTILKAAARKPNRLVVSDDIGLKCILYVDLTLSKDDIVFESKNDDKVQIGLESKRQVLEYLQKNCSMDFLRSHGLNSKTDVVLRKTNQAKLFNTLSSWKVLRASNETSESSSESQIGKIFADILKGNDNIIAPTQSKNIIAGLLHETCEEFPCFGLDNELNQDSILMYLFLGAVRDMNDNENQIFTKICKEQQIPTVGIRFGRVPEFTSKILSILAFHHANHKLGQSCLRLTGLLKMTTDHALTPKQNHGCLHVFSTVPLTSDALSSKLSDRDFVHWSIVRFVVCTLWRSRLVSTNSSLNHTNSLHLLFEDGVFISLQELDFVTRLAEKHHAAPCEFQILQELITFIQENNVVIAEKSRRRLYGRVFDRIQAISAAPITTAVVFGDVSESLSDSFYSPARNFLTHQGIVLFKPIFSYSTEMNKKVLKSISAATRKRGFKTLISKSIVQSSIDVAAEITCIQHLCYQERLFLYDSGERKRNRKRKAGSQQRKNEEEEKKYDKNDKVKL